MSLLRKKLIILIAILFIIGILVISYNMWLLAISICSLLLFIYVTNVKYRFVTLVFICFLTSFMLYQLTNLYINNYEIPRQLRILLNRSLLLIIVVGLYVAHIISKKKLTFYNHKPKWNILIEMPYHSIKLSYFMIIGLVISGVTFTPFILQQEISYLKSILFFCMLFSIINATLEELIWRGIVLSTLKRYVSVIYALAITSLGFGLLHIILGIPLIVCVLFSVGGLFYGFVVIKTNSIYPAILFHMVINIGMVFSGFIL